MRAAVDTTAAKSGVDLRKLAANVPLTGEPMTGGQEEFARLLKMAIADAIDVDSVVKTVVSAAFTNLEETIVAQRSDLQKQYDFNKIVDSEIVKIQAVLAEERTED